MKTIFKVLAASALLSLCASAHAQLSIFVTGQETSVKAKFTFWVDPVLNTLTIEIDNRTLGAQNAQGTITAIGFNTPFADGTGISLKSQTWSVMPVNHDTTKWNVQAPFEIKNEALYETEAGAKTNSNSGNGGNPQNGVKFGDVTTFVFQAPDFDAAQSAGFFTGSPDITVRWQEVSYANKTGSSDRGYEDIDWQNVPPTPEPSTYGLIGAGALVAMAVYRRRAKKA